MTEVSAVVEERYSTQTLAFIVRKISLICQRFKETQGLGELGKLGRVWNYSIACDVLFHRLTLIAAIIF